MAEDNRAFGCGGTAKPRQQRQPCAVPIGIRPTMDREDRNGPYVPSVRYVGGPSRNDNRLQAQLSTIARHLGLIRAVSTRTESWGILNRVLM